MSRKPKHKIPPVPGDVGFGLGFFAGTLLGALGLYLYATPEGRQLKDKISDEYQKHRHDFVVKSLIVKPELEAESPRILLSIRELITTIKEKIATKKDKIIIKSTLNAQKIKKKHYFKKK